MEDASKPHTSTDTVDEAESQSNKVGDQGTADEAMATTNQLPRPTAKELEEFNTLLNSVSTYNESADIFRETLSTLIFNGQLERALGFVQGENILLAYMKDAVILEFVDKFLDERNTTALQPFSRCVSSPAKADDIFSNHFDAALAKGDKASQVPHIRRGLLSE